MDFYPIWATLKKERMSANGTASVLIRTGEYLQESDALDGTIALQREKQIGFTSFPRLFGARISGLFLG